MAVLIGILALTTLGLIIWAVTEEREAPTRKVVHRLEEARARLGDQRALEERERIKRRKQLQRFLESVGDKVTGDEEATKSVRDRLVWAGFRHPNALALFMATRVIGAVVLAVVTFLASFAAEPSEQLMYTAFGGLVGWMAPFIVLKRKVKARQSSIRKAFPDALDLMVVCVEAGLGLNQAMQRVSREMERVNRAVAEEFTLVNLQIRAGTARADALRNMARRTGLDDIHSFVSMLIQSERFGTSVANALRVYAEELRDKRQQRAEEMAAKAGVKMIIPMTLFLLPAVFIVILGPSIFRLMDVF